MPPHNKVPKGAICQSKVFYNAKWTREVDQKFIKVLVEQAMEGNFRAHGVNTFVVSAAMVAVNTRFGEDFDYAYCMQRIKKLRKRYQVFKWIIQLSGVSYNPITHKVDCHQSMWDYICREEKLGMAYMLEGEHDFDELRWMFQEDDANESANNEVEVIEISSDHGDEDGPDVVR
ncbi:hypothetical protein DH2020_014702 [Rehmannia glutinosa]|uniref:Myb/SANT-like domain-containing protein n=1 Tax=Rehmannia glutinosa TaxID=99300 RepID=A0ABR0X0B9_REHGL